MLHSNPGDYAWGQGGLDAVITQVDTMPTSAFLISVAHLSFDGFEMLTVLLFDVRAAVRTV